VHPMGPGTGGPLRVPSERMGCPPLGLALVLALALALALALVLGPPLWLLGTGRAPLLTLLLPPYSSLTRLTLTPTLTRLCWASLPVQKGQPLPAPGHPPPPSPDPHLLSRSKSQPGRPPPAKTQPGKSQSGKSQAVSPLDMRFWDRLLPGASASIAILVFKRHEPPPALGAPPPAPEDQAILDQLRMGTNLSWGGAGATAGGRTRLCCFCHCRVTASKELGDRHTGWRCCYRGPGRGRLSHRGCHRGRVRGREGCVRERGRRRKRGCLRPRARGLLWGPGAVPAGEPDTRLCSSPTPAPWYTPGTPLAH